VKGALIPIPHLFQAANNVGTGATPYAVAVADVNGNGQIRSL
jgi:hypothetical protein